MRAKHDFESLEGEFKAIETELDAMKFINLELKRQVMSLDKEKIYNLDTSFYLGTNKWKITEDQDCFDFPHDTFYPFNNKYWLYHKIIEITVKST